MRVRIFLFLFVPLLAQQTPVCSQGIMEGGFVRAGTTGLGAGAAASMQHGKVLKRTFESAAQAQQAVLAQSKALEQSISQGVQLEAKKQWDNAEKYFRNALLLIARRDGPGSKKSVPVLQHLATISKAQNKLDDAIGYQKTILRFAEADKNPDTKAVFSAEQDLSNSYIEKKDYPSAETVLRAAVDRSKNAKSATPEQRTATLRIYGRVLRELHKDSEAEQVEKALTATPSDLTTQPFSPAEVRASTASGEQPVAGTGAAEAAAATGDAQAAAKAPLESTQSAPTGTAPASTAQGATAPDAAAAGNTSSAGNTGAASSAATTVSPTAAGNTSAAGNGTAAGDTSAALKTAGTGNAASAPSPEAPAAPQATLEKNTEPASSPSTSSESSSSMTDPAQTSPEK